MHTSKTKLLDAALTLVRARGYSATRIEDVCEAAGVTKGSFFHHFKGKEDLAVTAAEYWSDTTGAFFEDAPYHQHADPLDRVLGYVEFRKSILAGDVRDFTCLVGTMVQETYETAPAIRDACERSISGHAKTLEADIESAMRARGMTPDWTAASLALHTQAVLQGALILAKAKDGPVVAADSLDHLIQYLKLLFGLSVDAASRQPTSRQPTSRRPTK